MIKLQAEFYTNQSLTKPVSKTGLSINASKALIEEAEEIFKVESSVELDSDMESENSSLAVVLLF